MAEWAVFAIIGLGFGAVYASLGMGVVVAYKGTGVINFAVGAMGMWGAYVCTELRQTGDLVFPVIGVPDRVHLGDEVPLVLAVGLGLVASALVGLAAHGLVFRKLAQAPVLAKVVASVGLMIVFQALVALKFGTAARAPQPILPNDPIAIGDGQANLDRLLIAGIAVGLGLVLAAFLRWSRTGMAIRASAEDEQAAALAGFSPQLLAGITWVGASTLTGAMVILAAPITSLSPVNYTLYVVPALAAALVGRLTSLPGTLAAGLGLGVLQSVLTHAKTQTWYPSWASQGVTDALPFLVVVVALFVLGDALPVRGAARSDPLPRVTIPRNRPQVVIPLVVAGIALIALTSGSYRFAIVTSLIATVIALSLVLLTGLVGQISLAQAAFAGAAGFALSKMGTTVPFPLSVVLAGLVAAALGVVVGIPALRIRGAQLAVVTLAAGLALEQFVLRNPAISGVSNPIPAPEVLGLDLGVRAGTDIARLEFGLFVLAVVVLAAIGVGNIMRSATGRRFLAVRSNERAAMSLGIDVSAMKLLAFALASFLAGIGGSLIGYSRGQLSADSFGVFVGVSLLAFAYLGGITSISGAFVAGTFAPLGLGFVLMTHVVADRVDALDDFYFLIGGIGLVTTAIFNPQGIAGAIAEGRRLKRAQKEAEAVADLVAMADEPVIDGADDPVAAPPVRTPGAVVLDARDISVSYGGIKAVTGVSVEVRAQQIVGLIGPNGAGKTTFIDAVTGFVASQGVVRLGDDDLTGLGPHRRSGRGLVRTWQSLELFDELSVRQNLLVGVERTSVRSVALDLVRPSRRQVAERVDWALEVLQLTDVADARPSELSLGRQKLVGVARAVAMDPAVVLLDEPAAGLDSTESKVFGDRLRAVAAAGVAVLLVDHDMGLVLDACDDLYVIEFGGLIAHGPPAEVVRDTRVVEAYLGSSAQALAAS